MNHKLQWHERAVDERPRVTVHIIPGKSHPTYLCVDHYVNEYLYGKKRQTPSAVDRHVLYRETLPKLFTT